MVKRYILILTSTCIILSIEIPGNIRYLKVWVQFRKWWHCMFRVNLFWILRTFVLNLFVFLHLLQDVNTISVSRHQPSRCLTWNQRQVLDTITSSITKAKESDTCPVRCLYQQQADGILRGKLRQKYQDPVSTEFRDGFTGGGVHPTSLLSAGCPPPIKPRLIYPLLKPDWIIRKIWFLICYQELMYNECFL